MPSNSAVKFNLRVRELEYLKSIAMDSRIAPIKEQQKQLYLHSYLAGLVAAWDAYVKAVIDEFLRLTSNPADTRYSAVYNLLDLHVKASLKKLNTPNSENVRNAIHNSTGYDPIADWVWTTKGFNGFQTRERLNEILNVRHSFAHGFPMSSYSWNRSTTGRIRLTIAALNDAKSLFMFLVKQSDIGLKNTMRLNHGISPSW